MSGDLPVSSGDPLSAFARRIAGRVVSAFPEYAQLVSADEMGDMRIDVACPSPAVDQGLVIGTQTDLDDVWLGFHTHHKHFRDWYQTGTDDFVDEAIDATRAVIEERLVVVSEYLGGRLATTWFALPGTAVTELRDAAISALPKRLRVMRRLGLPKAVMTVTVRSWRGTHDADLHGV